MNASLASSSKNARGFHVEALALSSNTGVINRTIRPSPNAAILLSQLLVRLRSVEMPVIQFIHASYDPGKTGLVAEFARNAAAFRGRTLLVQLQVSEAKSLLPAALPASTATAVHGSTRKTSNEALEIVSDSIIPGLSHAHISCDLGKTLQTSCTSPESWLDGLALDFKLIVMECGSPERSPTTLDLATRCHGSVLVVTAGTTSFSQARVIMRQVERAGGALLGAVLHDAPVSPRWPFLPRARRFSNWPKV